MKNILLIYISCCAAFMQGVAGTTPTEIVKGRDGDIARKMRNCGFDEITYIGFDAFIKILFYDEDALNTLPKKGSLGSFATKIRDLHIRCYKKETINEETAIMEVNELAKKLSQKDKKEICAKIGTGNCGGLANHFLRYCEKSQSAQHKVEYARTNKEIVSKIWKKLRDNNFIIFRISLHGSHTFIGIKINDNVEILQAWQGGYSIKDWIKPKRNSFFVRDFIKLLYQITTNVEMAKKFYSVASKQVSLNPESIKIESFGFKTFNSEADLRKHLNMVSVNDKQIQADQYIFEDSAQK